MAAQGGMKSTTMGEWKQSWTPALYAAYSNLLLVSVKPFKVSQIRRFEECIRVPVVTFS
jgi:hypothetical protein